MTYILIMATIQRLLLGIGNLKKWFQWAYDILSSYLSTYVLMFFIHNGNIVSIP
jgi:hypothetical protein